MGNGFVVSSIPMIPKSVSALAGKPLRLAVPLRRLGGRQIRGSSDAWQRTLELSARHARHRRHLRQRRARAAPPLLRRGRCRRERLRAQDRRAQLGNEQRDDQAFPSPRLRICTAAAIADTAMFDPDVAQHHSLQGEALFPDQRRDGGDAGVDEYTCGRSGIGGAEGTWRDAEDGELSMDADRAGGGRLDDRHPGRPRAARHRDRYYWICAGKRYGEVRELDRLRARRDAGARHRAHGVATGTRGSTNRATISAICRKRSSICIGARCWSSATQCDATARIVAANDSDIEWGHNDHYSYMWPRDGAFVCDAMDRAGFPEITRRFLQFAHDKISNDGYFLHKYNPDGSLASSWHPWVRDGKPAAADSGGRDGARDLARWRGTTSGRAISTAPRRSTRGSVVQPAEFMIALSRSGDAACRCRASTSGRSGRASSRSPARRSSPRCSAAAELANLFNDQERRAAYLRRGRAKIRDAMVQHLWLEDESRFARGLRRSTATLELDRTVDASAFATFFLGVFPPTAPWSKGRCAPFARSCGCRPRSAASRDTKTIATTASAPRRSRVPGNPWLICTLWLAEHAIARATSVAELQSALDLVALGAREGAAVARAARAGASVRPARRCRLRRSPGVTRRSFRSCADTRWLRFLRRSRKSARVKKMRENPVDKPTSFS